MSEEEKINSAKYFEVRTWITIGNLDKPGKESIIHCMVLSSDYSLDNLTKKHRFQTSKEINSNTDLGSIIRESIDSYLISLGY